VQHGIPALQRQVDAGRLSSAARRSRAWIALHGPIWCPAAKTGWAEPALWRPRPIQDDHTAPTLCTLSAMLVNRVEARTTYRGRA
jgi:hypothetical protein